MPRTLPQRVVECTLMGERADMLLESHNTSQTDAYPSSMIPVALAARTTVQSPRSTIFVIM